MKIMLELPAESDNPKGRIWVNPGRILSVEHWLPKAKEGELTSAERLAGWGHRWIIINMNIVGLKYKYKDEEADRVLAILERAGVVPASGMPLMPAKPYSIHCYALTCSYLERRTCICLCEKCVAAKNARGE